MELDSHSKHEEINDGWTLLAQHIFIKTERLLKNKDRLSRSEESLPMLLLNQAWSLCKQDSRAQQGRILQFKIKTYRNHNHMLTFFEDQSTISTTEISTVVQKKKKPLQILWNLQSRTWMFHRNIGKLFIKVLASDIKPNLSRLLS